MWYSVSDTAEHGGYEGGEQLVTPEVRERMRALLAAIQSGHYADDWIAENRNGRRHFLERRRSEHDHPIEQVGKELRALMPFLDAKEVAETTIAAE